MTLVKDEKDNKNNLPEVTTKNRVAVYGSLRKGLNNHSVLGSDNELVGTFESQPIYNMYSVSGYYPALTEEGHTSIIMEVYELDDDNFENVNNLEGFFGEDDPNNHYNRKQIATPYGIAYIYLYNVPTTGLNMVESGDWKKYKEMSDLVNKTAKC